MDNEGITIVIDLPSSPRRVLVGLLLLTPFLLMVVLGADRALAVVASGLEVPMKLAELLFRTLMNMSTWIIVYAAWASGRYFGARQTMIQVTCGSLTVRTVGLFPPASTRRVNLRSLRDSTVRVLRYRNEAADSTRRPVVGSRLSVVTDRISPFRFAPGLTLAEASQVADVLNAAILGEPQPSTTPSNVWRLSDAAQPLSARHSGLDLGETVTPGPSPLLQAALAFGSGGLTLALAFMPSVLVFGVIPESDAMTSGVLWSAIGAGALSVAIFYAARAAYSRTVGARWTVAPLLAMPIGNALLGAGASVSLGLDLFRSVMLVASLTTALALVSGWWAGLRRRSRGSVA